ncbi:hypothetical protein [Winogradskyella sp.]|uniref:hypothetical protein n=1 Tax=Winogradskyella sp. TaxID=1883156 RepID=UPI003AB8764E
MKKVIIILGLITSIVATILSVTKFSSLAVTPIIIAFLCGLIILFLSKKEQTKTKTIQYIFLLVIISLSITIYKGVVDTVEIDNTEQPNEISTEGVKETLNDTKTEKDL